MGTFVLGARLVDDMLAEPVPVRRPGVCVMGAEDCTACGMTTFFDTGMTNMGSNL